MIFVDISVLPVVLPTLQREMRVSDLGLQWIVNAYALTLAVLVLAGGRIGDIWGMRKTFFLGLALFSLASVLCGLSQSSFQMIFSRSLQGVGGAFLIPATQGIILSHFPPNQRGKALGIYGSIGSVFLALGPLIGGSLTTYLSWHYVFWINLPIAAIGSLLALYAVPPMQGKREPFDTQGFLILLTGITALVVGLMQSVVWGFFSAATLLLFATGLCCLFLLFKRKHMPHASILDFTLLRQKAFLASASCIFTNQLLLMVTIFWAIYFQNILGLSASTAGAYAFLANLPILFAAPLGGLLVDRFGPRLPVMTGFGFILFALTWFCTFASQAQIGLLMPALLTFGFGVAMIYTPSLVAIMNEVPSHKRGIVSGLIATLRQFSSSLGLALFTAIHSNIYLNQLNHSLQSSPNTAHLEAITFEGLLSHSPSAVQNLDLLPAPYASYVFTSAKTAFLDGFNYMNGIGAALAAIGILIAWKLLKNRPIHHHPQTPP